MQYIQGNHCYFFTSIAVVYFKGLLKRIAVSLYTRLYKQILKER
jgi:hypothetical protein